MKEIKKLVQEKKLIVGSSAIFKGLQKGSVKKIWLSANVPSSVKDMINRYSSFSKVKVTQLKIPNDELGVLCKKQFSVSVVGANEN